MESFLSSWLLQSIIFFCNIYALGYWVIFRHRLPRGTLERYRVSSCCMSIVHGTSTSLAAMVYILHLYFFTRNDQLSNSRQELIPWLNSHLGAPNTPFEEAIMEYSAAYFLLDLLHYFFFVPNQPLFVLHHILTCFYLFSCRYYTKHGAFSTIVLFVVGECTSFLQNLWAVASLMDSTSLFRALNVPFLATFTVCRGIAMPWVTWKLCQFYIFSTQAETVVPFWLALCWMGSIFMGISGSLYWVAMHWAKLLFNGHVPTRSVIEEPPKPEPKKKRKYV